MLLRNDGFHKSLRDRKHMRVSWNGICDKFKLRTRIRKYTRSQDAKRKECRD